MSSSKSWKKKNKWRPLDDDSDKSQSGADDSNYQMKRESSPELARISALITRPPKQKSSMYLCVNCFDLFQIHIVTLQKTVQLVKLAAAQPIMVTIRMPHIQRAIVPISIHRQRHQQHLQYRRVRDAVDQKAAQIPTKIKTKYKNRLR